MFSFSHNVFILLYHHCGEMSAFFISSLLFNDDCSSRLEDNQCGMYILSQLEHVTDVQADKWDLSYYMV